MKIWKSIFNILLYFVSLLIPKSKKYVIIGGWHGQRYADNSRGIYEYLEEHKNQIGIKRVFWYTKNKDIYNRLKSEGRDVLYGYRLKSIYWHFRSKIHFIDQSTRDIIGTLSVRTIRVDLWHGLPLKKIGNYIHGDLFQNWKQKYYTAGCWADRYVLATSEQMAEMFRYAMGVKSNKMLIASYPRNKKLYLCNNEYNVDDTLKVFYLPTFRDNKEINPLLKENLNDIDDMLRKNNIVLYIKPHFVITSSWKAVGKLSNIQILEAKEDVYDWLNKTDLLITDYSSVFFDYLLTKRPIVFFPYDLEHYENEDRGFAMPYYENTPGDKVFSAEQLIQKIIEIKWNYAGYIKDHEGNYLEVLNKTNKYADEPNYEDILKLWK